MHKKARRGPLGWIVVIATSCTAACTGVVDVVTPRDASSQDAGVDAAVDADASMDGGSDAGAIDAGADAATCTETLCLMAIEPPHAPFDATRVVAPWEGWRRHIVVTFRGFGFGPGMRVALGERVLPPRAIEYVSPEELRVTMPPSPPGHFDVIVESGSESTVLPRGFRYDPVSVRPNYAPVGGGTAADVAIAATDLGATDRIFIGDAECTGLRRDSSRSLRCRVPPGSGTASVRVVREGEADIVVTDAFTYMDGPDPFFGGLGGGPLAGTLHVEVFDERTWAPVSGAVVVVEAADGSGTELATGATDAAGRATLEVGASAVVTLHVASPCHQGVSVTRVSQREARVPMQQGMFVDAPPPADCPPPSGSGRYAAFLEGMVEWPGPAWGGIPLPAPGERRVAYIGTTLPEGRQLSYVGGVPDPSAGGRSTVVEGESPDFRIASAPSYVSVYAVAGLHVEDTGEFRPYVLGVARDIAAGPEETRTDIVIPMRHVLDQTLEVNVADAPSFEGDRTAHFIGTVWIDLGGEGQRLRVAAPSAIAFPDGTVTTTEPHLRFERLPALEGDLAGATVGLEIIVTDNDGGGLVPRSAIVRTGLRPGSDPIDVRGFVPLASLSAGVPTDRTLRWTVPDGTGVNLWVVDCSGGSSGWRVIVNEPGARQAVIPTISGITDRGLTSLDYYSVWAHRTDLTPLDRLQLGALWGDPPSSIEYTYFSP